jgi:DNA-binding response OmpR family regulator
MNVKMKTPMKTGKKRILVVDDQVSSTRLVKIHLERTNEYLVREENDAEKALSAAEVFRPHLILLDVMMPGLSGGELATRIQANPELKAVPIVFLTSAVTKAEVAAVDGQLGGFPYLAKPFVLAELVACIKQHLGEMTSPEADQASPEPRRTGISSRQRRPS